MFEKRVRADGSDVLNRLKSFQRHIRIKITNLNRDKHSISDNVDDANDTDNTDDSDNQSGSGTERNNPV